MTKYLISQITAMYIFDATNAQLDILTNFMVPHPSFYLVGGFVARNTVPLCVFSLCVNESLMRCLFSVELYEWMLLWLSRLIDVLPPQRSWVRALIARGKSSSTLCRKSGVFFGFSGFLPQGKLTGWVRVNS